ncbi:MAG TPA: efflux RND transporter periplasmic adaptor subunit [Telluria sp.]|nr:efflux RND transporter periplasmic adaptor subunit [Telluria sp.]
MAVKLSAWLVRGLACAPLLAGFTVHAAKPPAGAASKPGAVPEQREIRAQLTPRRYTTLAAEIGARINRITVADGSRFTAGATLIAFDCSVQQGQLAHAKAALTATETTRNANRRLFDLHSISQVELDLSEAEVAKAKADLVTNTAVVSKCVIAAPFSGRVAEQKVREQQYVQPGQAMLEILDDSSLELEFIVPSNWLTWVKPGKAFQVAIDETGKKYPAKVQRVGARVDPVSQSVKLSAVIDGRFPELIAGMSGTVLIEPGR